MFNSINSKCLWGLVGGIGLLTGCNRDPIRIEKVPSTVPHHQQAASTDQDFGSLPSDSQELLEGIKRYEQINGLLEKIDRDERRFSANELGLLCDHLFEVRARYESVLSISIDSGDRAKFVSKYGPTNAPLLRLKSHSPLTNTIPEVTPTVAPILKPSGARSALLRLQSLLERVNEKALSPEKSSALLALDEVLKNDPRCQTLSLFSGVREATNLTERIEAFRSVVHNEVSMLGTVVSAEGLSHYNSALKQLHELRPDLFEKLDDPEKIRAYVRGLLQQLTDGSDKVAPKLRIVADAEALSHGAGEDHTAAFHHWPSDSITITPGIKLMLMLQVSHEAGHAVVRISENLGTDSPLVDDQTRRDFTAFIAQLEELESRFADALSSPDKFTALASDRENFEKLKALIPELKPSRPFEGWDSKQPLFTQLEEGSAFLFQQFALQLLANGDRTTATLIETIRQFESFAPPLDNAHIPGYLFVSNLERDLRDPWGALNYLSALSTNFPPSTRDDLKRKVALAGMSVGIMPTGGDQTIITLSHGFLDNIAGMQGSMSALDLHSGGEAGGHWRDFSEAARTNTLSYLNGFYPQEK